uniref:Dishevelled-binding antagonist of beta-catenin 3a n=1 Tax=Salarias fasciatus TaxID=181472 RepID=A0A672IPX2_SALFA
MHRAFSFPVTAERSRTKERLEASLSGLCELELRRQRQECLVLGALALGDPPAQGDTRGELACFSSWGQENLTLRRQLSALQSSPWGLMQALEQQVGELRVDAEDGSCDAAQGGGGGDTGDSRPSSGTSAVPRTPFLPLRPYPLMLSGEFDVPALRPTLPRSFSAPYPPLEGIAEEGVAVDSWQWEPAETAHTWQEQLEEDQATEEDYQQAFRVEGYILSLIQRHTLSPRPSQPRTTLNPDPMYSSASGHGSLHRRTPSLTREQHHPDAHLQPHADLSANPRSQAWGCDLLEGEACGGEAPSLEEDCYLALPYPQSRPHSLAGRLPSPLPSLDPNCGAGALDLCYEPTSPQHYLHLQPPIHHMHNLVSAQYIPGQVCHAPVRSPRHYIPEQLKHNRVPASPDHATSKSRTSKKPHNERPRSKKSSSKTARSQSENSLLSQRALPERRYSTSERHQGREHSAQSHIQVTGPQVSSNGHNSNRRWCSNLELSQDEGETQRAQAHRRPPRKARQGPPCSHQQQNTPRWHQDLQERAPLCRGEEGYAATVPVESESSMSEVYSPASSSLSSDSDESGGLVWPQQLPPRLASTSSSSSPSPQASANAPAQPKAFVKIKASHALKKKILRFRSGSLKVMTTV